MNTSDGLNRAAEIMMERGHTKERYEDADGRVCLKGALVAAHALSSATCQALRAVVGHVTVWNDRPETTEAMAIGALHEAAMYAKENGL